MATHNPKSLLFLSFILFLSASALAWPLERKRGDPRQQLQRCKQQCQQQHGYDEQMRRECERGCVEPQKRHEGQERRDPERQLKECQQRCKQSERQEDQRRCESRCQDKYHHQQQQQEEEGSRREGGGSSDKQEGEQAGSQQQEKEKNNPYFFDRESFRQIVKTQHGSVRILQPFHEKSKLLLGIANNRIVVFESNPNTFAVPHHMDAEAVIFVVKGRGALTSLRGENKQTHELRQGVIIRVEAGSIVYLVNRDNNEKLVIAQLLQPVSVPTMIQAFLEAGGENIESLYQSFSNEVLEAAFNSPRERIERVFGKQKHGVITRASEEQIRSIVRGAEQGKGSFNLLEKRPTHESNRGKLWEVDATDFKELRDLDLQLTFANISRGSMTVPFYNSRATKVTLVVDGRGSAELVTPQLSQQHEQEHEGEHGRGGQQMYTRVRSELRTGTVLVSPPGIPTVIIADRQQNLQLLCFEINAETNNEKIYLAGRNNPLRKMEKEAIELSFDASEKEVREVLDAQKENIFVAGPEERRRQEL